VSLVASESLRTSRYFGFLPKFIACALPSSSWISFFGGKMSRFNPHRSVDQERREQMSMSRTSCLFCVFWRRRFNFAGQFRQDRSVNEI